MAKKKAKRPEDLRKPDDYQLGEVPLPSREKTSAKQAVVEDELPEDVAFKFGFLGCGQGGSRIVNSFHGLGYRRTAVVNTTVQDFDGIDDRVHRIDLQQSGACKDPEIARKALRGREDEVFDLLLRSCGKSVDRIFVCSGLGGGTGTGLGPASVRIAKKYLNSIDRYPPKIGAIVSLPDPGEGQRVCRNAVEGFEELLRLGVSPLLIIDNKRIDEIYSPPITKIYDLANRTTAALLNKFNTLAAKHSPLMTFDTSEFADILDNQVLVMGVGRFETLPDSPADVAKGVTDQLRDNLLAEVDLNTGNKAACVFVAEESTLEKLSTAYYTAGFEKLERMLNPKANPVVHRGVYFGESDKLHCYTAISGLAAPLERLTELARKGGMDISQTKASFLGVDD